MQQFPPFLIPSSHNYSQRQLQSAVRFAQPATRFCSMYIFKCFGFDLFIKMKNLNIGVMLKPYFFPLPKKKNCECFHGPIYRSPLFLSRASFQNVKSFHLFINPLLMDISVIPIFFARMKTKLSHNILRLSFIFLRWRFCKSGSSK